MKTFAVGSREIRHRMFGIVTCDCRIKLQFAVNQNTSESHQHAYLA